MSDPIPDPMPATGGSYLRESDGSLTRIEAQPEESAAPAEAAPQMPAKPALKAPAEEE